MGNPPDPTNTQLFSSACGAQCYLKFMGSYMSLSNVKVLYNQNTPGSCENTWKTNAALDYQLYEQNPITANVLNSPPAWLNQAVGNLSENIDQNQVNNDYETCMVCDASQQTTSSEC